MTTRAPARSVAFIRAVMVGRQGLTRDALLRVFEAAGALDPVSHLATGNVSFGLPGGGAELLGALQAAVERDIAAITGRPKPVFIRSVAALRKLVVAQPFAQPPIPAADIYERCVSFTDCSTHRLDLPLTTARADAVVFAAQGRQVYAVTRQLDGRPGNPVLLIERALGRPVTTRNWNTVELVVAKNTST